MRSIVLFSFGRARTATLWMALPVCILLLMWLMVGAQVAAAAAPPLRIHSFAGPSSFTAAHNAECVQGVAQRQGRIESQCDVYAVTVTNAGAASTDGTPVMIADTLPLGLTVQAVQMFWSGERHENTDYSKFCGTLGGSVRCEWPEALAPDKTLTVFIFVTDEPGAGETLTNTVTVSGGGAEEATTSVENANGAASSFGVSAFDAFITGVDGQPETQAGGHPYELTTRIDLNNVVKSSPRELGRGTPASRISGMRWSICRPGSWAVRSRHRRARSCSS